MNRCAVGFYDLAETFGTTAHGDSYACIQTPQVSRSQVPAVWCHALNHSAHSQMSLLVPKIWVKPTIHLHMHGISKAWVPEEWKWDHYSTGLKFLYKEQTKMPLCIPYSKLSRVKETSTDKNMEAGILLKMLVA